jgi:hypothetical protein
MNRMRWPRVNTKPLSSKQHEDKKEENNPPTDHHVKNRRAPARGSQLVQAAMIHAGTSPRRRKEKERTRQANTNDPHTYIPAIEQSKEDLKVKANLQDPQAKLCES